MEHYLITRFNLNLYDKDKKSNSVKGVDWLGHRFELFEKFCLPSIVQQTCKDFTWLCLFNRNTPIQYCKKIETIASKYSFYVPLYLSQTETDNLNNFLIEYISSKLPSNKKVIITSRLDSDDALHCEFIQEVQAIAKLRVLNDFIINFDFGYQLITKMNFLFRINHLSNHFLTRIETDIKNFKTVMDFNHMKAVVHAKIENVAMPQKPMWLEIIHERNVSNYYSISLKSFPLFKRVELNEFGINLTTKTLHSILVFIFYLAPIRLISFLKSKVRKFFYLR